LQRKFLTNCGRALFNKSRSSCEVTRVDATATLLGLLVVVAVVPVALAIKAQADGRRMAPMKNDLRTLPFSSGRAPIGWCQVCDCAARTSARSRRGKGRRRRKSRQLPPLPERFFVVGRYKLTGNKSQKAAFALLLCSRRSRHCAR